MLNKKSKEQLISLLLLGSVFVFFICLKMNSGTNSEYAKTDTMDTETKVNEMVMQQVINTDNNNDSSTITKIDESIKEKIITKKSDFTKHELTRAYKYLDRNWRPDDTINMNAWEHVINHPMEIINSDRSNQVVNNLK